MKNAILVVVLALVAVAPSAFGKNPHTNKGRGQVVETVRFDRSDVVVIRSYYAGRSAPLPPGLQKKLARGKPLPPGWQKKLQGFPAPLEARLPNPCGYCGRGVVGPYGVIYDKRTSIVLDLVQLAGDILR